MLVFDKALAMIADGLDPRRVRGEMSMHSRAVTRCVAKNERDFVSTAASWIYVGKSSEQGQCSPTRDCSSSSRASSPSVPHTGVRRRLYELHYAPPKRDRSTAARGLDIGLATHGD